MSKWWSRTFVMQWLFKLDIVITHDFLCWDAKVRNRVGVLTATARSIGDMLCFRTSFMRTSRRASCLIYLIWRRYRLMSFWAIDYFIKKNGFEAYLQGRKSIQIVQKQHVRCFVESYADLTICMMLGMRHIVFLLLLVLTHSNCWRSQIWVFGFKLYAVLTISGLSAGLSVNRPILFGHRMGLGDVLSTLSPWVVIHAISRSWCE